MNTARCTRFFLIALIFCTMPCYASIDAAAPLNDNSWHFSFAPYGWMSSLDGDVTVKGNTVHAHIPFSEILQKLDFAGEAHLEASKNRWTFMIDPTYLKLSDNINQTLERSKLFPDETDVQATLQAKATLNSATTLIDGGIFYQAFATTTTQNQSFSFELLGGGRYFDLNNSIDYQHSLNITIDDITFQRLRNLDVSSNVGLIAPILGARFKYDPTPKSHFWLRGDGGGFDVDHVKSTWSATAGFAYTIHNHIDLGIAYRALDIDFTVSKAAMNILFYGPMAGIAFYS